MNAPMPPPEFKSDQEIRAYVVQILKRSIADFDSGSACLRIPQDHGSKREIPGMPFHPTPELFLQISGITGFEFPEEKFEVLPGEICLVPAQVPHREIARPWEGPFLNLVMRYVENVFYAHLARETGAGQPEPYARIALFEVNVPAQREILANIAFWYHSRDSRRDLAVKSGLLNHFFMVLSAIEHPDPRYPDPAYRVVLVQHLLAERIFQSDLSVEGIAKSLNCSASYISRIFKKETGISIGAYIIQQRLFRARHLLISSKMNIAEISRSVGYENPAYFTHLFRQSEGKTPRQYRSS